MPASSQQNFFGPRSIRQLKCHGQSQKHHRNKQKIAKLWNELHFRYDRSHYISNCLSTSKISNLITLSTDFYSIKTIYVQILIQRAFPYKSIKFNQHLVLIVIFNHSKYQNFHHLNLFSILIFSNQLTCITTVASLRPRCLV